MGNQLGMLFGDGLGGVPWIIICSKARWSRGRVVDEEEIFTSIFVPACTDKDIVSLERRLQ